MENLIGQFLNFAIYLIGWVLLAIIGKPLRELIGENGPVRVPLQRVQKGANETGESAEELSKKFWNTVGGMFQLIVDILTQVATVLKAHWLSVDDKLGVPEKRAWRIVGALVYIVVFILFIYADAIQGASTLSGAFPGAIELPEPLRDLRIAILIAVIGSVSILGLIIFDFLGSDLGPWRQYTGVTRATLLTVAILNLLVTIVLAGLFALTRYGTLSQLSPEEKVQFNNWGYFSQSAILIPMVISTLFTANWALAGILVIWLVIVGAILLISNLIRICFQLLIMAISLGGAGQGKVLHILFKPTSAKLTYKRALRPAA